MESKPKRAALYLRVSTDGQTVEFSGPRRSATGSLRHPPCIDEAGSGQVQVGGDDPTADCRHRGRSCGAVAGCPSRLVIPIMLHPRRQSRAPRLKCRYTLHVCREQQDRACTTHWNRLLPINGAEIARESRVLGSAPDEARMARCRPGLRGHRGKRRARAHLHRYIFGARPLDRMQ